MENDVPEKIIGAAIEAHRHLGPGLLEPVYEERLCYEPTAVGLRFRRQAQLPVAYKGLRLDCGYRMDLVVEDAVVVELKSVEELLPLHSAQWLTYLKASGLRVGLLINFNVSVLKNGLKRFVNRYSGPPPAARSSPRSACDAGADAKAGLETEALSIPSPGTSAINPRAAGDERRASSLSASGDWAQAGSGAQDKCVSSRSRRASADLGVSAVNGPALAKETA